MVAANQCVMTMMTMAKPGQFMRGIAAIAQKHDFSLWKPVYQHSHQLTSQVRGLFMPTFFSKIEFLRSIQGTQYRQSPSARNKWELYRNGQYYPPMPPTIDYMFVSRADCIVMAALAVDMFTSVLCRSIVTKTGSSRGMSCRIVAAKTFP